jgi:hypothetical protein
MRTHTVIMNVTKYCVGYKSVELELSHLLALERYYGYAKNHEPCTTVRRK